jgi:ketosteroid isomerase-like protein
MKKHRIVAVLFVLSLGAISHGQDNGIDSSIRKTLAEYDTAWNRKDVAAVSQILTDDYVYFSSTGGLTDRKGTLNFLSSPDYKLSFVERSEIKILSKSKIVAVVSSRWKGRGTYGKEEINDDQRCGLIFAKQQKRWKLLSEHCTQIVSK